MQAFTALLIGSALLGNSAAPIPYAAPVAWQRKALATAQRVWRPSCGTLVLKFADPEPFGDDGSWGGWAYLGDCTIYAPANYPWLGYPAFCTNVLHEAGHAAGRGHSDRGIMREFRPVGREGREGSGDYMWTGVDRRCLPSRLSPPKRAGS